VAVVKLRQRDCQGVQAFGALGLQNPMPVHATAVLPCAGHGFAPLQVWVHTEKPDVPNALQLFDMHPAAGPVHGS